MRLQEASAPSPQSGVQGVAVVAELVAALHDEAHGVVVAGGQLVPVKDEDLALRHGVLPGGPTNTRVKTARATRRSPR